jgi:TolB-like protein
MLKKSLIIILALICGLPLFGQDKPRLGILPFIGGASGDSETITTLVSYQREMLDAFTLVPLTNAVRAQVMEHSFQFSGSIDSDILARMGRMLNADYVISGQIRRLSEQNLVVFSIINVRTFELVAGAYREYQRLDDLPAMLPDIARSFVAACRRDTSMLPKLTVAPTNISTEATNQIEAETLAQILVIELANSGKFSVLPRMSTNLAVMRELDFQLMGRAVNARYVLNTEIRSQVTSNMASAAIFNVDDGSFIPGGYRNYYVMNDGIGVMVELARILSSGIGPVTPVRPIAPAPPPFSPPPSGPPSASPPFAQVPPSASGPYPPPSGDEPGWVQVPGVEPGEPEPPLKEGRKTDPAKLWTIGVSVGSSFSAPWFIGTVHGTIAPFKNIFLELGCDVGLVAGDERVTEYYSVYPYAHIAYFLPFGDKGGWYAGLGAGFMMAFYTFDVGPHDPINIFALDAITGVNLWNFLDISYTIRARTDFTGASNKLSVGFTYRF